MRYRQLAAITSIVAILVGACTGSTSPSAAASAAGSAGASAAASTSASVAPTAPPPPDLPAATSVGAGEGELNLIAWAGYVVGGTGGEKVQGYDWVTPFEKATGCKTTVKVGDSSSTMVQLMKTGQYDGVSASGDATLRLIYASDAAPVNLDLIPNYKDVFEGLKNQSYNTIGDKHYGVPQGRGANLLMWRTDKVTPDPDSWSVVFDPNSPYKGKVTAYDYEIYIADAAVYLMATKPELGIKDPYSLDATQFQAAVDLLKAQRKLITKYWATANDEVTGFGSSDMVVGTSWQYMANLLTTQSPPVPIKVTLPKEGSTAWSDTWMIAAKAKHPNCMYKWMDYIISPKANADVTVYWGEAPVSAAACAEAEKQQKDFCKTFHADDETYFKKVYYWNTPRKDCLDGRGAICTDFAEWTKAWTEIKSS